MFEEIRLYIMQRLVAMNKNAFSLEDGITPSIRKREWIVFPSGFQELEVRKGDQSYDVNLQNKFSIKPVFGLIMSRRTNDVSHLPPLITAYIEEAPDVEISDTTKVGEEIQAVETSNTIDKGNASTSVDKGKAPTTVENKPAPKRKRGRPPSHVDGIRIYHKNCERSKKIANMKLKKPF
ncbi:hypothetical protein Tco_0214854 [Tanacetum coccineum]